MSSSADSSVPVPIDLSDMLKGKPHSTYCWQKLKSYLPYVLVFALILVMSFFGLEYFEITPTTLPLMAKDHAEAYRVKVIPAALSDEELIKLPKETFSYIAMIDAGSSGCRAHVYRYGKLGSLSGPLYLLPQHNSKKVKPGLSTFAENPADAGPSLRDLVEFLKAEVPQADWEVTPVFLKATAGLRMLQPNVSLAILQSVRGFLSDRAVSPFLFRSSYAAIISGNEEGGFGWIAFNYLKKIIGPRAPTDRRSDPYAVIEMGGASAQVSQAAPSEEVARSIPDDYRFSFTIEQDSFHLYTHSYLGYGAEQARELFNKQVGRSERESEMCYNPGYRSARHRRRAQADANATVTATATASAGAAVVTSSKPGDRVSLKAAVGALVSSCLRNMGALFRSVQAHLLPTGMLRRGANAADNSCAHPGPHSFNCVHQPDFVLQSTNILTFENFFYVSSALGVQPYRGDGDSDSSSSVGSIANGTQTTVFPLETTPESIRDATAAFCHQDWSAIQASYPRDSQPKDVNIKACFLGTYAYSFLVEGLRMPADKVITVQKEVAGSEIEWALGAAYKEAAGFLKRTNLRPT